MTANELRELAQRQPFTPFTIHMNDGSRLKVAQPDDIFVHRTWRFDAVVILPGGRFSIIYLPSIADVSTSGRWPRLGGRRRRNGRSGGEEE